MSNSPQSKIGFVGLGAMGSGMAKHLVRCGYNVVGFDVAPAALEDFEKAGGTAATSPRHVAIDSAVMVVVTTNSTQVDGVLFDGDAAAVKSLPATATLVICSTVTPLYHQTLQTRLQEFSLQDLTVIDAPISGGALKAANGTLTIVISGPDVASSFAWEILNCLSERVYHIPGGAGKASMVKMINQLLAGVHIVAAAEAMAFAANLGLNTRQVFDEINKSRSWSWMFNDRVEHMLRSDWIPKSALNIFVKDMGIVTSTSRSYGIHLPISEAAERLYISASNAGYGQEDDSGIVRVYLPEGSPRLIEELSEVPKPGIEKEIALIRGLLSAIYFAATAEALAFCARVGLDVKNTHNIIKNAAGASRIFVESGEAMIQRSTLLRKTFQEVSKDLEIALERAKCQDVSMPLATAVKSTFASFERKRVFESDRPAMTGFLELLL